MAKVSGGGSRAVFGAILVLVGLLLLLSQLGLYEFGDLIGHFWPLVLIIIGLWQWALRRFRLCFWPLLLIVVGLFFLALQLGLLGGRSFGALAGIILVLAGALLIIRKARPKATERVSDADAIDQWVIFGGVEEKLTTQTFNGGNATVVFGGAELDLRKAALSEGDITLSLTAIFGGIEIKVPEDWHVIVDGTAILGGVEDKTGTVPESAEPSRSCLRIEAVAIFGGVEVGH
jgi:predicted membrane protein